MISSDVNVTIRMYRKWKIKMYIQRICAKLFTEVINVNTALSIQLRILGLNGIKPNFSELARMYGLDRRTVKKYYDGYEGKPAHHNKSSKLDKHLELIKQKLSLKGVNVRAVYEYILDEVDPDIGTYSNFNKYVKAKELKPKKTQKGHPRYETAPGIQAQVDWKEDITIRNRYGENFTFQVFNYKPGYSGYPIFTYRLYKTRQDVIDCLIRSFKLTGGVPKEILFDNMSSVVTFNGGHTTVSSAMKEFAKDLGFQIKRCKARHAYTKGKVEAANKFMDWLLPYEGEFETEEELIEILDKINLKVQQNICQQTCVPPVLLFQKEKEYLQPMPSDKLTEPYLSHDRPTTVRKDSMVNYMNRKYSVPAQYIGKPVKLRESDGVLYIYFSTDVIAKHRIGEKRLNYTPEHYRQLLAYHMTDPEQITELAEKNLRQMDEFL